MMGGGLGGGLGGKPAYEPPQFAQFEVGKTGHAISEDALPPMPSWETAQKKHVPEEEKDAVELGDLDPATGQRLPLMAGAAGAGMTSPPTPSNEFAAGPYAAGAADARLGMPGSPHGGPEDPYGQNRNAFNQNTQGYRGTPSPGPGMMGGRGYGPGHNGMDNYGPLRGASPGPNNGFADAAVGGYGQAQGQYPNDRRPFPPQPVRQFSNGSARPLNPGRQYSAGPYQQDGYQQNGYPRNGPPRGPGRSPPPANTGGFDFGIDNQQHQYSTRPSPPPQQPSYGSQGRSYSPAPRNGGGYSTGPPSYATRTPPPQEQHSYQAYVPHSESRAVAPASSAAGGRAREPEHWDPVQQ